MKAKLGLNFSHRQQEQMLLFWLLDISSPYKNKHAIPLLFFSQLYILYIKQHGKNGQAPLNHEESPFRYWSSVNSASERVKQMLYIDAYMWNLEKWYRRTYLQSKNRDIEIENKHMDTKGKREGGIYICMCLENGFSGEWDVDG